jgi:Domain of unknown function (DUF4328)
VAEGVGVRAGRAATRPESVGRYSGVGSIGAVLHVLLLAQALSSLIVAGYCATKLSDLRGSTIIWPDYIADQHALHRAAQVDTALYALCAVVFVAWTYRAYRNLRPLGAHGQRFRSGWAIGCWLVPVLALWRPKQVVNDIWRGSDSELPADAPPGAWRDARPPSLLAWWWGTWLVSLGADRFAAASAGDAGSVADVRTHAWLLLGAQVLNAAAACLAAGAVESITDRQRERARRITTLPLPVPGRPGFGPERPASRARSRPT